MSKNINVSSVKNKNNHSFVIGGNGNTGNLNDSIPTTNENLPENPILQKFVQLKVSSISSKKSKKAFKTKTEQTL